MTPTEYWQSIGIKSPRKVPEEKNDWSYGSVDHILERQEYIGDTLNFKSTTRSFKDHTKIHFPKEELKIFKNHHEPIIDEETWNNVQKIRQNKRRQTKTGKSSIFSGHLFCKECGSKLYYCVESRYKDNRDYYRCSKYKNYSTKSCTSHHIKDAVIKYVHEKVEIAGKKYQQIDIHYAGVGIITIPVNEYGLENTFQQSIKKIKSA